LDFCERRITRTSVGTLAGCLAALFRAVPSRGVFDWRQDF
jgi:hypothetical protein